MSVSNYWKTLMCVQQLFRVTTKKPKLCISSLCAAKPPVMVGFRAQKVSDAESVRMSWRHHVSSLFVYLFFQIAANLANLDWSDCPLPINHVTPQKNDFRLHIQHGRTFSCLCQDLARPEALQPPSQPHGELVLHVVSKATTSSLDLVALRTAILAQHIERLAQANG